MDKNLAAFFNNLSPEVQGKVLKYANQLKPGVRSLGDLSIEVVEGLLSQELFGGSLAYAWRTTGKQIEDALYKAKDYLYGQRSLANQARSHELSLARGADPDDALWLVRGDQTDEEEDYGF